MNQTSEVKCAGYHCDGKVIFNFADVDMGFPQLVGNHSDIACNKCGTVHDVLPRLIPVIQVAVKDENVSEQTHYMRPIWY